MFMLLSSELLRRAVVDTTRDRKMDDLLLFDVSGAMNAVLFAEVIIARGDE